MQFATDWDLEFDFTDGFNMFVDDFGMELGTFPDITLSSDEHSIKASTTTSFDAPITMMLTGGGMPGLSSDNSLLILGVLGEVGIIGAVVLVVVVKKRQS